MNGTALRNKEFYDKVAFRYEQADGRRSSQGWLKEKLFYLTHQRRSLLDVGAGTGLVSRAASEMFEEVVALDVSQAMLDQIRHPRVRTVCYNGSAFPFDDNRFDVVVTFATLHHVADHLALFKEIRRVLKPGGVYYSDHDINASFYRKFRPVVEAYRALHNAPKRFGVSKEEYEEVEFYRTGLDVWKLNFQLAQVFGGCDMFFHWQGLLPFSAETRNPLLNPLIRFTARKEKRNALRL